MLDLRKGSFSVKPMIVKNTVHIIGSKDAAGAERFGLRLMKSLHERGLTVTAMLRRGSTVVPRVHHEIPVVEIPMKTVWDPISKFAIKKELQRIKPQVVQLYTLPELVVTISWPGTGTLMPGSVLRVDFATIW
jgi:hypothetical protein